MSLEQTPVRIYASGLINSDIPTDPVDGSFLDFVAEVDDYATLRFTRGIAGPFEITINKNTLYSQEFQRKRIIQLGDDVYKCGVIESVQNEVGEDGALSEIITVKGRELIGWLDRRYIDPPAGQAYYSLPSTTPAETVIKSIIDDSMGPGATDADRTDSNLVIEADTALGADYVLSARYDNLLQVVANCCLATNSRVFAYLDHTAKTWNIGFSLGLDRTSSQTTNPQAVFSTTRETVQSAKLIDTEQSYRNVALVAGQGEGASRTTLLVPTSGAATGIERREMFVDARDLTLTASLENRGLQKLSENQYVKFLTSDILAYSQLKYGTDYDVGDEVTIEQFDLTQNSFITSLEEYWAPGQYKLMASFDRSSPTLSTQTSGMLGQMQKTLNATELAQDIAPTATPTFASMNLKNTTGGAAMPTPTTGTLLQIGNADTIASNIELLGWGALTSIIGRRIGGTIASPSATLSGNTLIRLDGMGRGTTIYTGAVARVVLMADQDFTDTANGTRITFFTTPNGSTTLTEVWRISNSGSLANIGAGTAYLHFKAGVATASGAPIKFTAGTNLTAAEAGAVEWNGTNLFITQTSGPTRKTLAFTDSTLTGTWNGAIIASTYGGTGNGFTKFSGPTTSEKTFTLPNASATVLTTNNATTTSTPADPTGASTTELMMGLAGSFTPANSTRILVTISGQMSNNTINDGVTVKLRTGTGTAPANAAAATGTQRGAAQTATSLVAAQRSGFSISAVITGLTAGTAYWIDASVQAITGGTASIFGVTISAVEV